METSKRYKVFKFKNDAQWTTARECLISGPGKPETEVSSPPEFKGKAGVWTPEDMFVASVNVCILLSFVNFAQHKNLGLASYESSAEGVLEYSEGAYRFTEITLHPHITLKSADEIEQARSILEDAHKTCLISNSILAKIKLFPDFRVAGPPS